MGESPRHRATYQDVLLVLYAPELHLDEDILVPDLTGWRRERMATVGEVAVHEDDQRVRAEPFDAVEIDLAALWSHLEPLPPPGRASEDAGSYESVY
jgi:hypothetical protein